MLRNSSNGWNHKQEIEMIFSLKIIDYHMMNIRSSETSEKTTQ